MQMFNDGYYLVSAIGTILAGVVGVTGVYWRLSNRLALSEKDVVYLKDSQTKHDRELDDQRSRLDSDLKEMNKTLTEIRVSIESLKPKA